MPPSTVVPYIPYYPVGFFVHFVIGDRMEYIPLPFKRIPFARKSLGYHVHFVVNPKKPPKPPRDFFHALLACVLAGRIHQTDKAVREVAWRMWQNCEPTPVHDPEAPVDENGEQKVYVSTAVVMQALVLHSRPLALVDLILRETELRNQTKRATTKKKETVKKGPKPKAKKAPSMKTQGRPIMTQVNNGPKAKAYG